MPSSIAQRRAIAFALAAFTFWVFADTNLKIIGASALPAYEVVAILGLCEVFLLLILALGRGKLHLLRPQKTRDQLFRSLLDLGNQICVVIALRHLPLALFYILIFLAPIVTTVMSTAFLGETLDWKRALAVLTGFLGVLLAVLPYGFARHADWTGYLACLVCVACFSANIVLSRFLTATESSESLTFSSALLMAVAGAAAMLHHAAPVSMHVGLLVLLTSLFCVAGSLSFFFALSHASAAVVAQYHYSQLVTGALFAYLFLHERPTPLLLLGATLIILAGCYTAATATPPPQPSLS